MMPIAQVARSAGFYRVVGVDVNNAGVESRDVLKRGFASRREAMWWLSREYLDPASCDMGPYRLYEVEVDG